MDFFEQYFIYITLLTDFKSTSVKRSHFKSFFDELEQCRHDILKIVEGIEQELLSQGVLNAHRKNCLSSLKTLFRQDIVFVELASCRIKGEEISKLYSGVESGYVSQVTKSIIYLNPLIRSVIDFINDVQAEDKA